MPGLHREIISQTAGPTALPFLAATVYLHPDDSTGCSVKTSEFEYYLPPDQISQLPAEPRDSARLMVLHRKSGEIEHRVFRDLGDYLRPGDLLILNDTRVIPARLYARKAVTGGRVEMLLLDELRARLWRVLVRGGRVRKGTVLELQNSEDDTAGIKATVKDVESNGQRLVEFSSSPSEWLEQLGHVPLPPYIQRYSGDPERYQTVYARHEGSAAAPTAGLHFTPELLVSLLSADVRLGYVTLRIGLDTFKPIDSADISEHTIHTEWARVAPQVARQVNDTRLAGGRIVAVGTTSVRTLETSALLACSAHHKTEACAWSTVRAFEGPTDLYIVPGHEFRAVDAMITNFHLPRSSLLVLVSAFAGKDAVRRAYLEAVERGYRFYSFGDAMLIL